MRDLIIRPARPEDFKGMAAEADADFILSKSFRAFTALGDNGDLVFIAGIAKIHDRSGEAWNIPGPAFREYLAAPREIRRLLRETARECDLIRVQSQVSKEDAASLRFDLWLGFVPEAYLKDAGPHGETVVIMRWRDR